MTTEFDTFINNILQEYYLAEPDFQNKVNNAISGTKVKLEKFNLVTQVSLSRNDAPKVLKALKNSKVICFYEYPVNDPARLLLFKNVQDVKTLVREYPGTLDGFAKY